MRYIILGIVAALAVTSLISYMQPTSQGTGDPKSIKAPASGASKNLASDDEVVKFIKDLQRSNDPKERETANGLQDFFSRASDPPGPLWSRGNLGWHTDKIVQYEDTLYAKPPFYSGSIPLQFTHGESAGTGIVFYHDFGSFRNEFKLDQNFLILGARTVDKSGALLAEARIRYYAKAGQQGIELEEFHYDSAGKVIFRGKSEIDSASSFKIAETVKTGKKIKEYYFLWPANSSGVNNTFALPR